MDASSTFKNLINKIETSNLNYVISKTPFSAQISIKRSFVKDFKEPSHQETTKIDSDATTELKEKLTSALEHKERLEEVLRQERIRIKSLECQVHQCREDLLVVKNEKNISNKQFKTQENELNELNQELVNVNQTNKNLEHKVKEKNKLVGDKTRECKQHIQDKVELREKLENALLELEVKKGKNTENNNELKINCSLCDADFMKAVDLRQHIRSNHCKDQVSQTRSQNKIVSTQTEEKIETSEYPCFYCDHVITSLEDLMKHKYECPVFDRYQDKCDQCDAKFEYRSDLINHYKANHPEISIIWCDFCQAGFETIGELQSHIRIEHRDYLPG